MIILGIAGLFHDAAAALIRDGELLVFVEEERLIRQKHAYGKFPHHAIRFCLQQAGISTPTSAATHAISLATLKTCR